MIQNLWDPEKTVLKGKFTVIQAYLRKQEKPQMNNVNLHPKEKRKPKQNKTQS